MVFWLRPLDDFMQIKAQQVPDLAVRDSPLRFHDVERINFDLQERRALFRCHKPTCLKVRVLNLLNDPLAHHLLSLALSWPLH